MLTVENDGEEMKRSGFETNNMSNEKERNDTLTPEMLVHLIPSLLSGH